MQTTSLTALLLLLSGCNNLNTNLNTPVKPKINESVGVIDNATIKSLSDITSIAFEWQRVEDPRVIGYNFYRANMHKDGRRLKLVKSINNKYATHYLDRDLEPGTKYVYQISSRIANDIESRTTDAYVAKTLQRIVPVSFVQGLSELPKQIKIVWRPHPDQRIAYYRIQKFNTTINEWIRLKTVDGRLQAEYIDTGLSNNSEYKYKITAYTFNDVATQSSNVITAKTKPLPKDVTGLTASNNQPNKILLQWEPSTSSDVIRYEINRSIVKSFGYSKIKEVSNNTLSYSDSIDNNGKEYYYKVIAVDKDNLKSTDKVTPALGSTLIKPKKPSITLAQIQGNQAIINWIQGDNRAISYNIYKRTRLNFFEYKTTKFTDIQKLRFEDNDIISGVEYKYSIQANDEFGLMSDKTDEAELILPKPTLQK
jgi:fibronectin type 3 domain-containing protein